MQHGTVNTKDYCLLQWIKPKRIYT